MDIACLVQRMRRPTMASSIVAIVRGVVMTVKGARVRKVEQMSDRRLAFPTFGGGHCSLWREISELIKRIHGCDVDFRVQEQRLQNEHLDF